MKEKPFKGIDITGKRYGRLVVIGFHGIKHYKRWNSPIWECRCDCGNTVCIFGDNLRRGLSKSCGCLRKEITSKRMTTHGQCRGGNSAFWSVWNMMKQRCGNPNNRQYRDYGGRGIKVCNRWLTFENFYADMHESYKSGLSIERVDVNGPYSKENCRWATSREQQVNKRNNRRITFNGKTMCASQWAEELDIKCHSIYNRLNRGWSVERTLTTQSQIST